MKILVAEKISSSALKALQEPGWVVVTPEECAGKLPELLADADALLVRSAVKVDAALLEHAGKNLRVIGRAGVGVDNVDLDAATKKGIAVMNTPGANAVAVAEHTLLMMLAMARHLCKANALLHAGKWEKKSLQGTELRGKKLGILGLGKIGMEVARRAVAFDMEVIGYDPFVSPLVAREKGIRLAELKDVLATADYLTLHMALTPQTDGLINAETLAQMKKGVRIVNCARGELIHEADLAEAVKSGQVGAAAIDVFVVEPAKSSPLFGLENVIVTPHLGGSTNEAQEAVGVQIAMQVKEYLKHGVIQNAVNVPSVSYEEYVDMQPFMVLAERMGRLLAQLSDGRPEEVNLRYSGRLTEWKTDLMRNAVLKGLLDGTLTDPVNVVNAAAMAEAAGVRVHESKRESAAGGKEDVLALTLKSSTGESEVRGTVLHGRSPRLLHVNGTDIEAPLGNQLIYLRNRDVPGVIGRVGTLLGQHAINIGNFSLGRRDEATQPDGVREAVALLDVDSPAGEAVIAALRAMDSVLEARTLKL